MEQPDGVHHGGIHPLAEVAGVVPAAGQIDVLAVVAAAGVVQMANRMDTGHGNAAPLRPMVRDGFGQRASPDVRTDEERDGTLISSSSLTHQHLAANLAEVSDQAIAEIGGNLV